MKDSGELREAVKLWLEDKSTAKTKYGHISLWNTSNITDILAYAIPLKKIDFKIIKCCM